jgi:hypothetical protein
VIACNLFGLGVSEEVCWTVWIVVYALLIAFLMWMRKRDGGGWGVRDRGPLAELTHPVGSA